MGKGKNKQQGSRGSIKQQFQSPIKLCSSGKQGLSKMVRKEVSSKAPVSDHLTGTEKNQHEYSSEELESISESDSESLSKSLGEEDTIEEQIEEQISISNSGEFSAVPEIAASRNEEGIKVAELKKKPTYASLLVGNRQANNGSKLQKFEVENDSVQILDADLDDLQEEWKQSLIGYFAGRFPGIAALQQLITTWKEKVTFQFHNSGWIIFKCESEEAQQKILQDGPYMVFGRPLLLKTMPQYFRFDNEELSKFPVWVQLRNLPLELWSIRALSKICSKIGKPIYADQLTSTRARVSYARVLVEVDVSKEVLGSINLLLPNGEHMKQEVLYENLPQFCTHCKRVGHSLVVCKNKNNQGKVPKTAKNNETQGGKTAVDALQETAETREDQQQVLEGNQNMEKEKHFLPRSDQQDESLAAQDTVKRNLQKEGKMTEKKDNYPQRSEGRTRTSTQELEEEETAQRRILMLGESSTAKEKAETTNQWQSGKHKSKQKNKKKDKE